jgi:hypothetical protein
MQERYYEGGKERKKDIEIIKKGERKKGKERGKGREKERK